MTDPAEDPGWPVSWKMFVPWLRGMELRQFSKQGTLAGLRAIFVSFVVAIVLFGVVLALVVSSPTADFNTGLAAAIVAGVGVAMVVVGGVVGRLDGSSAEALAGSYRSRFFVRIATSEAVALVGFVLSFLTGDLVPYLVAMPFTAIGFWRAAPTAQHLQEDQDALNAQGATVSLREVLR